MLSEIPRDPRHVVVIVGGAVAGSEAAAVCAERGLLAVVVEQNDRPFGKIEDGLPRWHAKLRDKEYARVGENLKKPGVLFVPSTALGKDIEVQALVQQWGASAVLLASGAWRDRTLPVSGASELEGSGLVYQNSFIYWYNHYPDSDFDGQRFEITDGTIVVGGGLASIDVVKVLNFELYKRALARKGIAVTSLDLEHAGIPKTLDKHGLTQEELGVKGCTLYYRRDKRSMPLATPPPKATEAQRAKIGDVRAKVLDKVIAKYGVRFVGNHAPSEALVEDGRMVGLKFQKTATIDGKLQALDGEFVDVRAPVVISSIGSIPLAIPGIPMKGELIDFASWDTGEVNGLPGVFGLGNALTGKGNIKDSRKNAALISQQVLENYLGVGDGEAPDVDASDARKAAEAALDQVQQRPVLDSVGIENLLQKVQEQWKRTGYDGDFDVWIKKVMPTGEEQPGQP